MHIGAGMYGATVLSPREPLPAAKEFVRVQRAFHLRPAGGWRARRVPARGHGFGRGEKGAIGFLVAEP
jgi:hypothetical protein